MQDNHIYGFNKLDSLELLQKIGGNTGSGGSVAPQLFAGYIIKAPTGGIAGRSGTTVTFEDCDVYYIDGTTLTSSGDTVPVGNMSATAVASEAWGMTFWAGGALLAVWEDC